MKERFDKLIELINKQNLKEGLNDSIIPSLKIYKSTNAGEIKHSIYNPSLFVILQGSKLVIIGDKAINYDTSSYLVSSTYMSVTGKIFDASKNKPFLSLVINFTMEQIFEALEIFASKMIKSNETNLAIQSYKLDNDLFDVVYRHASLLKNSDDIEFLEDLYLKEILYRLLISNKNIEFWQYASVESNAYKISKAISFINDKLFEPISMEEISKEINLSISAFHKHFKAITSLSPLQYIKVQRLQKARSLMISQNMDISGASYFVGYQSPSQFSREYSKYFGLSPSMDIKNIRKEWNK